jgi:hypothetical protein
VASFVMKVPVFFLQSLDVFVTLGRVFKIDDDDFYYLYVLADMISNLICQRRAFSEDENDVENDVEKDSDSEEVEMVDRIPVEI